MHKSEEDEIIEAMIEIEDMICASELEILEKFANLPGAVVGDGMEYVFVPGLRDVSKRALIVAHCDTVWNKDIGAKDIVWHGGILAGTWANQQGIGADDRVGCAAAMRVALIGEHSVLITTDEECGAIGAQIALFQIPELLREHVFALQVDRRGDQEIAFYPGGHSKEWAAWLDDHFQGWNQCFGTFTDITVLCDDLKMCGANLAAGYMYEHTVRETFFLDAWFRTMDCLEDVLKLDDLPKFKPDKQMRSYHSQAGTPYSWKWWEGEEDDEMPKCVRLPSGSTIRVSEVKEEPASDDQNDLPWWETRSEHCLICDKVLIAESSIAIGLCWRCQMDRERLDDDEWPEEIEARVAQEHMLYD